MSKRSTRYQYQTTTKTIQSQITAPRIDYTQKTKTVTVSNPSKGTKREKIEAAYRNNKDVDFFKCNKCGKLKYSIHEKHTTKEGGSWSRRTDITEVSRTAKVRSFTEDKRFEKYAKYNQASQTLCKCGKIKTKCICNKKDRNISVTSTSKKRSDYMTGEIDLTPKVKINLNPEKIRKAVEEQKRIAEEDKKRRERRSIQTEENVKRYTKEEKYNYNKTKERHVNEDDLCHCGEEGCISCHDEDLIRKKREEELKRAKLIEQQRLKRIEEERIKRIKIEEEERRRREEEERRRREEERRRRRE